LADANKQRDWRIFALLAAKLIAKARKLYAEDPFELELDETVYALDATTIDLCLQLFPWADFRRTKAAVKLHTLLDLRGNIPTFIEITQGKVHDVNALDELIIEPGAYYIMDRGYLDFARLFRFELSGAFFVIRAKKNLDFIRHRSQELTEEQRAAGVRSDHVGRLRSTKSIEGYPELLRRVRYFDEDTERFFVFLTNNMCLPAELIATLYKMRWQIELFFKWIKQNLRIKRFYGNSANAVKTQIWIAICTYLLVAIQKKQLDIPGSLHRFLQVLSVNPFAQVPLNQLLTDPLHRNCLDDDPNQLMLWDL
jgi:IS4 transposase